MRWLDQRARFSVVRKRGKWGTAQSPLARRLGREDFFEVVEKKRKHTTRKQKHSYTSSCLKN